MAHPLDRVGILPVPSLVLAEVPPADVAPPTALVLPPVPPLLLEPELVPPPPLFELLLLVDEVPPFEVPLSDAPPSDAPPSDAPPSDAPPSGLELLWFEPPPLFDAPPLFEEPPELDDETHLPLSQDSSESQALPHSPQFRASFAVLEQPLVHFSSLLAHSLEHFLFEHTLPSEHLSPHFEQLSLVPIGVQVLLHTSEPDWHWQTPLLQDLPSLQTFWQVPQLLLSTVVLVHRVTPSGNGQAVRFGSSQVVADCFGEPLLQPRITVTASAIPQLISLIEAMFPMVLFGG